MSLITSSAGLICDINAETPAPLATTIANDNFTRANGALGTTEAGAKTWQNDAGTFAIDSNRAVPTALISGQGVATVDAGTRDASIEATLTWTENGYAGVVLAGTDADNFLSIRCYTTVGANYGLAVFTRTSGVDGNLGFGATVNTNVVALKIGARIKGRVVDVTVNGVFYTQYVLTLSQANALTGTRVGLFSGISGIGFDNVKVKSAGLIDQMSLDGVADASGSGTLIRQTDLNQLPLWKKESGIPYIAKGPSPGSGLTLTFPETLDYANLTIFIVAKNLGDVSATQYLLAAPEATAQGLILANGEFMNQRVDRNYSGLTTQNSHDTIMWMTGSASGFPEIGPGCWMGCDGRETFRTQDGGQATYGAGAFDTAFLGGLSTGQGISAYTGAFRRVLIYNRTLSVEQCRTVLAELALIYGVRVDEIEQEYYALGDSITSGAVGGTLSRTYFDRIVSAQTKITRAYNFGISGQKMSEIKATLAAKALPTIRRCKLPKFATLFAGTNDLASFPNTVSTVLADGKDVGNAILDTGAPLAFLTTLPRGTSSQFETDRTGLNDGNRSDDAHYTVLADIALNAQIGVAGAQNNNTYFSNDLTHLKDAGHAIVAATVIPVLAAFPDAVETGIDLDAIADRVRAKLASDPVPTSTTIPTPPSAGDIASAVVAKSEFTGLPAAAATAVVDSRAIRLQTMQGLYCDVGDTSVDYYQSSDDSLFASQAISDVNGKKRLGEVVYQ